MGRSRKAAIVSGVVVVMVAVAAMAVVLFWRAQSGRLDDMRSAVTSFEAPAEWVGWTRVTVTSRDYSPLCIDVVCPSYGERYLTAVPAGDVGPAISAAMEEMAVGPVTAPNRQCVAGSRCLFTIDADGFTLDVVFSDPFDPERGIAADPPAGFVEVAVTLNAY